MKYDVKKPKINTEISLGGKKGKKITGEVKVSGLLNNVKDLSKPTDIDTKVVINKKKGIKIKV